MKLNVGENIQRIKSLMEINSDSKMEAIITEDRFIQLTNATDTLEKIINNFDQIDCEDRVSVSKHKYVRVFCEQLKHRDIKELIEIKDMMEKEIEQMIYQEFSSIKNK